MSNVHYISHDPLTLETIDDIINNDRSLALSDAATERINKARKYLDDKQSEEDTPVYGVNTGFGSLCNIKISKDNLTTLQEKLVISHASGTGDKVPKHIVKLMLLLKVRSLSYGHSGASLALVQQLIAMFNHDVLPVVYEQGSLGASGDLAPLAHLSIPLIGLGKVYYNDGVFETQEILEAKGWKPLQLKSKEGLALLNGTQFMSAYGVDTLMKGQRINYFSDLIASISIDAFQCRQSPYDDLVQQVRPHQGQVQTAQNVRSFLKGTELSGQQSGNVQDPYSFRCVPQVHGACKDGIQFVNDVVLKEINSVTDNPNIFVDEDKIISGGNFHGQVLAMPLDYMAINLAELSNISERRIYQLVSGHRGLPAFLIDSPGLNSGLMIPQYTAASIVSQNKQSCTPASVDSIVSSNGQEDHVSMGANAATKLFKVTENTLRVLAIELINASQAIYFREPRRTSPFIEEFLADFRKSVPIIKEDKIMSDEIKKAETFLTDHPLKFPG